MRKNSTPSTPTNPAPAPSAPPVHGWEKWHTWNERNMQPLIDWVCDAAQLAPGQRVLDAACGTGLPALAEVRCVAPGGHVVAVDVAPGMLEATGRIAAARGVTGLELQAMDLQELRFPDASFDAVSCCFGVMFCPDPVRAIAELRRVLRPGGRLVIAVWGDPAHNPFFTTVFQSVERVLPMPPSDPTAPGMFRFAAPGELAALMRAGAFLDAHVQSFSLSMESESFDQHFAAFCDMAPPLSRARDSLPVSELERIRTAMAEALAPFMVGARVRVPATALCASAQR